MWLAPPTLSPSARPGRWSSIVTRQRSEVTVALTHTVCVPLFDISNCNCDVIGERERANLVVQLAPFFCILYISIRPARPHSVMFYVVLNMCRAHSFSTTLTTSCSLLASTLHQPFGFRHFLPRIIWITPARQQWSPIRPARPHTVMFYVVLNMRDMRKIFCITHCTGSSHCSRAIAVPPSLPTRS